MNPYNNSPRTMTIDRQKVVDSKIDYLLASFRPFGQDPSYDELQNNAIASWSAVARRIILFNTKEDVPGLADKPGITLVGPDANPPSLKQMFLWLQDKHPEQIAAIVNSDIVLTADVGKIPMMALKNSLGRAWACTSFRQTINPETGEITGPEDYGLDLFCSTVRIWNDVAQKIPGVLTLGKPVWDNWLNSFLHSYIDKSKYIDLTPWQCVLHPRHGGRERLQKECPEIQAVVPSITGRGGLPDRKLAIPQ